MPPNPRPHTHTTGRQTPWRRRPPRSCPPRSAGGSSGTRGRSTPCASMVRICREVGVYVEACGEGCTPHPTSWGGAVDCVVNLDRRQTVFKCFCNPSNHTNALIRTTSQGRILHDSRPRQGPQSMNVYVLPDPDPSVGDTRLAAAPIPKYCKPNPQTHTHIITDAEALEPLPVRPRGFGQGAAHPDLHRVALVRGRSVFSRFWGWVLPCM